MDRALLLEADHLVASLSPGRRESVREIVLDAARHGSLSPGARRFLDSATGSTLVADVLEAAITQRRGSCPEPIGSAGGTPVTALEEARADG